MLIGMLPPSGFSKTLTQLENSPFHFVLTGSHFFGNATEDSDYDFFVQEDKEGKLANFLQSLNFNQLSMSYTDMITTAVWCWRKHQRQIHVQVVTNVNVKMKAQTILKKTVYMPIFTKTIRAQIWNAVISALLNETEGPTY
jgi:hypothetical protein